MLEKEKRRQDYYSIRTIISEVKEATGEENPTANQVLEFMIGNSDQWCGGDFVVYKYSKSKKRTFLQRFNMIWVYPLFIITIPFQYLFLGDWGINRNSKFGKIIDKLVKFT